MKLNLVTYFLFLLLLLSLFVSGVIDSLDGFSYLAVARNIYYEGEPTAPPNIDNTKGKGQILRTFKGKNGKTYATTGLGYSLALVPAVAVADLFYKYYGINHSYKFPLENDWLILLTASFTNIIFGAALGVVLLLYFLNLGLSNKHALLMSLIAIFATNLWVYTKYSFAHMMFIFFLVLTFYLLRKHSESLKRKLLFFAGISFGILSITYNQTFLFWIIPLILYYVLLIRLNNRLFSFKKILCHLLFFLAGFLPFFFIYNWFENTRAMESISITSFSGIGQSASMFILKTPPAVLIEGVYGQLFSPGRSIFLYSPLLLLIFIFWRNIKSICKPELIIFLLMLVLYVSFYSTLSTLGKPDQGYAGLWHGESSWGPRYLTPLIPFGMLLVGVIFVQLKNKAKLLVFVPLLLIGLYVNFLGILMPYQVKFHELEEEFHVNSTQYTLYTYSNLLPRYSPVFMMSKKLVKNMIAYPKTLDHGEYNVRFYDGIYFPFNVGQERWRVIEGKGYISFDNNKKDLIKKIAFGLINHPIGESSSSANLQVTLNTHRLLEEEINFAPQKRSIVEIPINPTYIKDKNNQLEIGVEYEPSIKEGAQIFAMISMAINDTAINMESLDFPYYSDLGPAMVNSKYNTYGGEITDPWKFWDLHTQIYERIPDFWWMRTLYYWDYPKMILTIIFLLSVLGMLFFAFRTFKSVKNLK